jgi:endoglucanase
MVGARLRTDMRPLGIWLLALGGLCGCAGASWWSLAREAIAAIRAVDSSHLIILDPLAGVDGGYGVPSGVPERIVIDDPNLLYDIHFYEPAEYVNQGAPWMSGAPADGGRYPDDTGEASSTTS